MNILICDDVKAETEKLSGMIRDSDLDINITVFLNASEALAHVRSGAKVDVCFLDIVMPEMSGVVLADKLRTGGFTGEIVFLTTSNEFATESYMVKAFSYLIKPPSPERLHSILSDLENARINGERDGISVKLPGETKVILFRDISHVEVIQHYVYFRLINGFEIEICATLAEYAPLLLRDTRFVRCSRSYIVNMDYIETISRQEITVRGGARIPISKNYPGIKDKLLDRMMENE